MEYANFAEIGTDYFCSTYQSRMAKGDVMLPV